MKIRSFSSKEGEQRLNNIRYKIICVKFRERKKNDTFLECGRTCGIWVHPMYCLSLDYGLNRMVGPEFEGQWLLGHIGMRERKLLSNSKAGRPRQKGCLGFWNHHLHIHLSQEIKVGDFTCFTEGWLWYWDL